MATIRTIPLQPYDDQPGLDRGSLLFVGTATTLVQLGPFTLLTDPNFLHAGDHAHLGYGMTSERLTNPAVEIEALPPLDACVLSHFHGDHWDEVATAKLPKELPVLTTHHAARALRKRGFSRAHALTTWEQVTLTRGGAWLRVTAMPARHGPRLLSALLPPVMGSMLEWGMGAGDVRFRMYVSGDTLVHDDLRQLPERYPDVDLGLLHLGGTRVLGVLVTMDAAQGVEALRLVHPQVAIPVHYDDYPIFESPLEDFVRAVEDAGLGSQVRYLARGERYELAARGAPERPGEAIPRIPRIPRTDATRWRPGDPRR